MKETGLSTTCKCPKCGIIATIKPENYHLFWLTDTKWKCPECGWIFKTNQLEETK